MTDWFCSDLHYYHDKNPERNIVVWTDRHKYTSVEDHTRWLTDTWNSTVGKNDTVYHLGDFAFTSNYDRVADLIASLNGHKVFIQGNHCDSKLWKKIKANRQTDSRLGSVAGVDKIVRKHFQIEDQKRMVVMCHFPFAVWEGQQYGAYCLHGHSHGSFKAPGRILDVGLDSAYNIFGEHRFFKWEEIVGMLEQKEIYLSDYHGQAD